MIEAELPIVVVAGSLHYDIMIDAPDRPRKGETVTGYRWWPKFGGKGGNQAVAAAKAGARVRMAGAVGDDDFGRFLLRKLDDANVDSSRVAVVPGASSGMSVAISDAGGDYGAVIVSGANLGVQIQALADPDLWQGARTVVLQNEMSDVVNIEAARAARRVGATVCLNAAPYRALPNELAELVDVLVVNSIEAEQLGGSQVSNLATAVLAAERLSQLYPAVVVTAGGDGVAGCRRGETAVSLEALPVTLVSTHGAGDVFVGTLATALADGKPFVDCLRIANMAAATHVSTRANRAQCELDSRPDVVGFP